MPKIKAKIFKHWKHTTEPSQVDDKHYDARGLLFNPETVKNRDRSLKRTRPDFDKKLDQSRRDRITAKFDSHRAEMLALGIYTLRELSPIQRKAIRLMVDFNKRVSMTDIAKQLDVPVAKLYKWRNDPLFAGELDKEITKQRSYGRLGAFRNIFKAIDNGDVKVSQHYLEKFSGDSKQVIEVDDKRDSVESMSDDQLTAEIDRLQHELAGSFGASITRVDKQATNRIKKRTSTGT